MNTSPSLWLLLLAGALAVSNPNPLQAQDPRPDGGPGGRREGGREGGREGRRDGVPMRIPNPMFTALDVNQDGVIDQAELANATAMLRKLDRNGDGKITEEEVRPTMSRPGGADQAIARMMEFDKNGDGKLSMDELPERMRSLMERADTDKDGFLSRDEIRKLAESISTRPSGEGRERREGGDRPAKPAPEK